MPFWRIIEFVWNPTTTYPYSELWNAHTYRSNCCAIDTQQEVSSWYAHVTCFVANFQTKNYSKMKSLLQIILCFCQFVTIVQPVQAAEQFVTLDCPQGWNAYATHPRQVDHWTVEGLESLMQPNEGMRQYTPGCWQQHPERVDLLVVHTWHTELVETWELAWHKVEGVPAECSAACNETSFEEESSLELRCRSFTVRKKSLFLTYAVTFHLFCSPSCVTRHAAHQND